MLDSNSTIAYGGVGHACFFPPKETANESEPRQDTALDDAAFTPLAPSLELDELDEFDSATWKDSATPAPETAPEQGSFAVSSALLEPNHHPNPSPGPINDPQLTIPEGLWGEAYENLRTENAELLNAYENILLLNWHSEDNDAEGKESINSRLRALINHRLEELQKSRLKFNVAGKEVVVKDEVHRALKSILSVNNFITTAVSSDSHASLAWAGGLGAFVPDCPICHTG
ncbi:hypothetical protein N7488_012367 [Penicillium malachiteum]|nr:hypothetical protein N7488_012367 [Penicillium malachiteum]